MANRSAAGSGLVDRRTVLQVGAALAAAGQALMREGHAAARPPVVIDAQVHAYAANTPERPWHSVPNWPAHVTGDEMVAAMDKVGVDGAIYISPFLMYQYDGSYAVSVQRAHPDKFALVKPVDPDDPAVADVIADWKQTSGTVGIRIILTKESNRAPDDRGLDRILRAAVNNDFPVKRLVLGQHRRGHGADRPPPRRAVHHRPYGHPAAERTTRAAAALGRSSESAGTRQTQECGDQDHRRLHAVEGALSVPGHLGSTPPHIRRLGVRALLVGHGLDARVCGRQLRAGRRALPEE
jgi:hypothetical protein